MDKLCDKLATNKNFFFFFQHINIVHATICRKAKELFTVDFTLTDFFYFTGINSKC